MAGFGRGKFGRGAFGRSDAAPVPADIGIVDEVSISETLSVEDTVGRAETLSVGESLAIHIDVPLSDSLTLFDFGLTGAFSVNNIGGNVVRVTFPTQMHYDGLGDAAHVAVAPVEYSTGVPVTIQGLEPLVEVIQQGNEGAVIPERVADGIYDLGDGVSTHFRLVGMLDLSNVGDFINIRSGQNAGTYQIVDLLDGFRGEVVAVVDRPMVIVDGTSRPRILPVHGAEEPSDLDDPLTEPVDLQLVAIAGDRYTFIVKHPAVTPSHPIFAVTSLVRRTRLASTEPVLNGASGPDEVGLVLEAGFALSNVRLLDYRTVRVEMSGAPRLRGASLAEIVDRFSIEVQVDWESSSGVQSIQGASVPSDLDNPEVVPVDLQLILVDGNAYTFRAKHPALTEANPIQQLYRLARLGRPGSAEPSLNDQLDDEGPFASEALFSLSDVELLDHRTFTVVDASAPGLRGEDLSSIVDRFSALVQLASSLEWEHTTGVLAVDIRTSKLTDGGEYLFRGEQLFEKWPKLPTSFQGSFRVQGVPRPRVVSASCGAEGQITVAFDDVMSQDPANLTNPRDYELHGPSPARVKSVRALGERSVVLGTHGLTEGPYTLSVSTNTPKDLAGNPLDPDFNEAVFTGATALTGRSVFTDRGPITKPPLTLQDGSGAELPSLQTVSLPGAALTVDAVGKRLRLSGSVWNSGTYDVVAVEGPTRARVRGVLLLPDASSGALAWSLYGPSTGPVLQNGAGAAFPSAQTVSLPGGTLTQAAVGQRLRLSGSASNDGAYDILAVEGPTLARVRAHFVRPDANSGAIDWAVVDAPSGPPLNAGVGAELPSVQTVSLPGASLTQAAVGKRLRLSGSAANDGVYDVLGVEGPTRARVRAHITYPDANSGAIDWELFDPRTGQIADDPSDVVVRINGTPVVPTAVIGLKGQVVLPVDATGDVELDYSWMHNPRVEVRRLNSLEFRLNNWNRDHGGPSPSGRHYRYNNVLMSPGWYDPDDMRATLEEPLLRNVKYRAYERAYTASLNDPTSVLFNTPSHRIAFPASRRQLREQAVFYEGSTLPEVAAEPWIRRGAGSASSVAGALVVVDNSAGTFPTGSPLFWTRPVDLSFDHVFSVAWRFSLDSATVTEGAWTGIAAGYANDRVAYVVGYLNDGGVRKVGILKRGAGDALSNPTAWGGGFDASGNPTGGLLTLDWSVLHSYRFFTDRDGVARLYVDGSVVESLRMTADDVPFLQELNAQFSQVQGVFFGSLSRPAVSTSTWDFYRYISQPINAFQTAASSFVSYEADVVPEKDSSPWTPVGFHGTASTVSGSLLLASTSAANDAAVAAAGLVGGDFHGYVKIEPLLSAASQVVVDVEVQLLTYTHGIDPNGLMVAVDDGTRLLQLSFFPAESAPRLSYGGRSLPTEFSPYTWSSLGGQSATMRGRILRIADASASDGKVFFINDGALAGSPQRVVGAANDYILEARFGVVSYTADGAGYVGAFAQVFDGVRAVGFKLVEIAGQRYVAFHSDGEDVDPTRAEFDWLAGGSHTYRLRKNTAGNLVTLFIDGVFKLDLAYDAFDTPVPDVAGMVSFGSSTPASNGARSVVDWSYCNAWRVASSDRQYVGLWKGTDPASLTGYHLPLSASGTAAAIGNVLDDPAADFEASAVEMGAPVIVDEGPNKGTYQVATVESDTRLTLNTSWPAQPTTVRYRIARQTRWSDSHKYRLARDSTGAVSVFLDSDPLFSVDYDSVNLPPSAAGIVQTLSGGLPAIAFGSFSAPHLEQSRWGFLRYGIARGGSDLNIVPPHQVLNQWNVMESPERLMMLIPHSFTSFKSSSTGVTPQTEPDFLSEPGAAFTQLNEGTPPVPATQTFERRRLEAVKLDRRIVVEQTPVASADAPEDLLQDPGTFTFNDGTTRYTFKVPADVLYTSMQLVETSAGEVSLLAPLDDAAGPMLSGVDYKNEVCATFGGGDLANEWYYDDELNGTDPVPRIALAPWVMAGDDLRRVTTTVDHGTLTYATRSSGTRTALYLNTPLPDAPSLQATATFQLRLVDDATQGQGDSGVRFGLSAPGLTVALGFVTHPLGERFLEVFDLNTGRVVGRATFDYLDGAAHDFRIVRDPSAGVIEILIDE